jgi:hypothetical protein
MSWKQVLDDKSKYPDDLKLNINGLEVSVGDLRAANAQREAALKERETLADQKINEAATFYSDLVKQQDELAKKQSTAQASVTQPAAGGQGLTWEQLKADPLFKPVAQQLEDAQKAAVEAKKLAEEQAKQYQQGYAWALNHAWKRDFESIGERDPNIDLKAVLKFAVDEKVTDEAGVPDVRKAYDRMTAGKRQEAAIAKAREEGLREGQQKALLASIPKPGLSGLRSAPETGQAPKAYGSLDEALAAAKQDPDLMGQLSAAIATDSLQ